VHFIRLTACDLRCSYCDTAYAFTEGKKQSLTKILAEVKRLAAPFKKSHFQFDLALHSLNDAANPAPKKFPAADETVVTTASPCCLKPAARMTSRR